VRGIRIRTRQHSNSQVRYLSTELQNCRDANHAIRRRQMARLMAGVGLEPGGEAGQTAARISARTMIIRISWPQVPVL